MNTEELKRLAQAEMALRGSLEQEAVQKWCDTLRELRQAVPDWCVAALELIDENERLKADSKDVWGLAQSRAETIDLLMAEVSTLKASASLAEFLPQLDEALEDLELHGRHDDQGYRKLKDWYRKVLLAIKESQRGKEGF